MADINVRLIYAQLHDGIAPTASGSATGFPPENGGDLNRSTYWKGDSGGSPWGLYYDLGADVLVTGLGFANHNLGTIKDGGGTVKIYQEPAAGGGYSLLVTCAPSADDSDYFHTFSVTAQKFYVEVVAGGATPDPQIGEFYLGTATTLANNPDTGGGFRDEPISQTLSSASLSGLATVKKTGRITRRLSLPFTKRITAEWTVIEAIHASQDGPYKPFFYVPRNDSAAPVNGDAFMVRFTDSVLAHSESWAGIHEFTVNLREEQ